MQLFYMVFFHNRHIGDDYGPAGNVVLRIYTAGICYGNLSSDDDVPGVIILQNYSRY
jgi:hypothetical protein